MKGFSLYSFSHICINTTTAGTGNRPPITVPAKGVWMRQDLSRATKYLDISFQFPDTFPVNTLKVASNTGLG